MVGPLYVVSWRTSRTPIASEANIPTSEKVPNHYNSLVEQSYTCLCCPRVSRVAARACSPLVLAVRYRVKQQTTKEKQKQNTRTTNDVTGSQHPLPSPLPRRQVVHPSVSRRLCSLVMCTAVLPVSGQRLWARAVRGAVRGRR